MNFVSRIVYLEVFSVVDFTYQVIRRGDKMTQFVKLFIMSAGVFLVFDLFWLLVISKKMYQQFIGHLMGETRMGPALIFYFLYIVGVVFFVLLPGIEKNSLSTILFSGALFGLICYGTYDLTNLATLKGWPVWMTVIDLCWGTFVTASTAGIVYAINAVFFEGVSRR